jgi:hypothetical protein
VQLLLDVLSPKAYLRDLQNVSPLKPVLLEQQSAKHVGERYKHSQGTAGACQADRRVQALRHVPCSVHPLAHFVAAMLEKSHLHVKRKLYDAYHLRNHTDLGHSVRQESTVHEIFICFWGYCCALVLQSQLRLVKKNVFVL